MRAARYLGVSFFDMQQRPVIWRTRALIALAADEEHEEWRRSRRGRGGCPLA